LETFTIFGTGAFLFSLPRMASTDSLPASRLSETCGASQSISRATVSDTAKVLMGGFIHLYELSGEPLSGSKSTFSIHR
jgi:hypothetical protein